MMASCCRLKRLMHIFFVLLSTTLFFLAYNGLKRADLDYLYQIRGTGIPCESAKTHDILDVQNGSSLVSSPSGNGNSSLVPTPSQGDPLYFPYKYIINEAKACDAGTDIINIIPVSVNDIKNRILIRDLWGNPSYTERTGMKTLFLLGTSSSGQVQTQVEKESDIFHDILQLDIMDTYHNLTLKTLSILHWVNTFCPTAHWVLKSDVDVFVNPFQLSVFLGTRYRDSGFVCIVHPNPKVCHEQTASCPLKWVIPREVYPRDKYPSYCRGPAYIIHSNLVGSLFKSANKTHPFVMEDVYFTGILAEPLNPKYFHLNGEKFPFYAKDVRKARRKSLFLLLNLESSKKKEHPNMWNKILNDNRLPRQKIPGPASVCWSLVDKVLITGLHS